MDARWEHAAAYVDVMGLPRDVVGLFFEVGYSNANDEREAEFLQQMSDAYGNIRVQAALVAAFFLSTEINRGENNFPISELQEY